MGRRPRPIVSFIQIQSPGRVYHPSKSSRHRISTPGRVCDPSKSSGHRIRVGGLLSIGIQSPSNFVGRAHPSKPCYHRISPVYNPAKSSHESSSIRGPAKSMIHRNPVVIDSDHRLERPSLSANPTKVPCNFNVSFVLTEIIWFKAEVRRSFITTTVRDQSPRSHHKGAITRFELATNGIQLYAIAKLDKTSLLLVRRRFAAALLLARLFGTNPRSHHKGRHR